MWIKKKLYTVYAHVDSKLLAGLPLVFHIFTRSITITVILFNIDIYAKMKETMSPTRSGMQLI